jgi:hypothetical protein
MRRSAQRDRPERGAGNVSGKHLSVSYHFIIIPTPAFPLPTTTPRDIRYASRAIGTGFPFAESRSNSNQVSAMPAPKNVRR